MSVYIGAGRWYGVDTVAAGQLARPRTPRHVMQYHTSSEPGLHLVLVTVAGLLPSSDAEILVTAGKRVTARIVFCHPLVKHVYGGS